MCTLTFLPLPEDGFLLTSNRDESPLRMRAHHPEIKIIENRSVIYPMDGKAGGTWIGVANDRRTVCLLNGAFERHAMGSSYRLSRGIVVLDSFKYPDFADFVADYDFEGIEPFTYVDFLPTGGKILIREMRWDGNEVKTADFDAGKPQIWSSAQLYRPEIIKRREEWFGQWINEHPNYSLEDIRAFHRFGGEGDIYNDIRMNRDNMVKTVSTTAIENNRKAVSMVYDDLLDGSVDRKSIDVE
jgi:hypothetical protein